MTPNGRGNSLGRRPGARQTPVVEPVRSYVICCVQRTGSWAGDPHRGPDKPLGGGGPCGPPPPSIGRTPAPPTVSRESGQDLDPWYYDLILTDYQPRG